MAYAAALLLLLLLLADNAVRGRSLLDAARPLQPDAPRLGDTAEIGGSAVRYRLLGLQPGKVYEVRVSFPGTAAVRVALWLGSGGDASRHRQRRRHRRQLLDAEKVVFATDGDARVRAHEQPGELSAAEVLLRVERWGRWRHGSQGPAVLVYDVVLERSVLGVPRSALPLLATALLLVLLAAAAAPWWSRRAAPAVLQWLHGGGVEGARRAARLRRGLSDRPD